MTMRFTWWSSCSSLILWTTTRDFQKNSSARTRRHQQRPARISTDQHRPAQIGTSTDQHRSAHTNTDQHRSAQGFGTKLAPTPTPRTGTDNGKQDKHAYTREKKAAAQIDTHAQTFKVQIAFVLDKDNKITWRQSTWTHASPFRAPSEC